MFTGAILNLVVQPSEIRILFVGNSHTAGNNVPSLVEKTIESAGRGIQVKIRSQFVSMLNDVTPRRAEALVANGAWDFVVIQGAAISSSHRYRHEQTGALALARAAAGAKAKCLLFAEWSRRGWDEAGYILGIYQEIATATDSEVIPVPVIFDEARAKFPRVSMWQRDGNHATLAGSFAAASTISRWVLGEDSRKPTFQPAGLSKEFVDYCHSRALSRFGEKSKTSSPK